MECISGSISSVPYRWNTKGIELRGSIKHEVCELRGRFSGVACYSGLRASPRCCTIALAWRTPPNLV
ncbi:hypothetical protein H5410_062842 [Solanum commersonii]|uniref:Uncharacterized protein n=1 Tax=Solanum commersonii TaxID=4109 RepID=A0A9J5WCP6_SOLCO|nr:hypothetical protein H5410_062842 [Solanum commersonii]